MMEFQRTKGNEPLSSQVKQHANSSIEEVREYDGNFGTVISTGSTLLNLAISGGRVRGGGLPGGILVEAFGPNGSGKTVLLCEIAGYVQRKGGSIKFDDPEARLNKPFAKMFGMEVPDEDYNQPNTVNEVFAGVRNWKPATEKGVINGIFADSLAALSTDMEMEKEEGDKMGMKRAKDFSEQLRKTCRIITQNNYLMVCSNQIRENVDAGPYAQKHKSPGGEAIGFYSSLRLRFTKPERIKDKARIAGKDVTRVIGVRTEIEVFKSSIWKPYHVAPVTIIFDYGIDDIRENLQFVKDYTKNTVYYAGDNKLSNSMEDAITQVEENSYQKVLRNQVIDLWEEIEDKFKSNRIPKR